MRNVVLSMDCMELMEELPENYFDLAICDPPYGIGAGKMQLGPEYNGRKWKNGKEWDNNTPDKNYFKELFYISKNQIIWGANFFSLPISRGWIFWDKGVGIGMSFSDGELARSNFNLSLKKVRIDHTGYRISEKKIHPTQKPVALYKWLLTNYAKPGMKIFDSHVGSGSSRIACYDMGFDFVGCELDKDYWQAQEERFQNHIKQAELFTPEERQKMIYKEQDLFGEGE